MNPLHKILVVDDEPDIREVLSDILEDEGYEVYSVQSAEEAEQQVRAIEPDVVLLDVWMQGEDGMSLYRRWSEDNRLTMPVIMISGHGTIENAVEATQLGAYDFLEKPLSTAKLLIVVRRALESNALKRENAQLLSERSPDIALMGNSEAIVMVRTTLDRIAPTEGRVFIEGESGCGKGVAASALHKMSSRASAPCLHLNLAAIPRDDLSMRLFGVERDGEAVKGQLEMAQGGTLVLDEVGDLDEELQNQLVRVLEAGSVTRVGGTFSIDIDVRIVATTSQNMTNLVQTGRFLSDLYHRLNVLPLKIPALRERLKDIEVLTEAFVNYFTERENLPRREFDETAFQLMRNYQWPGNIRELRNFVQRVLIMVRSQKISAEHVGQYLSMPLDNSGLPLEVIVENGEDLKRARVRFEKNYFENLIEACDGNMTKVARFAGVERTHLYRKLKTLGITTRRSE